ncbi:MAG TPA: DUF3667 domain-containing protein [Thermoanaerobaculia bacterium]|nr:DUF3667 domain-containing protein [Thermoanaerobaculia bacterium]
MTHIKPWTCPACNSKLSTRYCPDCGESPLKPRDHTLRGLFRQLFHALSSIDGRLIRSLRYLVTRPGALTVAYVQGRRLSYLGPFQLLLVANVLFFAMQSLTSTNIASSTLDSHLHHQDWQGVAQRLVAHRLETKRTTLDLYAPIFDQANVLHAKSFIIVMALPFALLLPVLFYRSRQPFVAYAVFSLHFYAFLLLLFCVLLAIAATNVWLGGAGLSSPRMDNILSLVNLAACAMYLYAATGTAYGARGALRVAKALALSLAVTGILLGYRFMLFLFTLYTT